MKCLPRRLTAAFLSLLLLLLTACTGAPAPSAPAMGRYVESSRPLPGIFALVASLHRGTDGALELLGYLNPEDGGQITLSLYRSADEGVTWTEESPDWLSFFNGQTLMGTEYATLAPDGTLWFNVSYEVDGEYTSSFARLVDGTVSLLPWAPPDSSEGISPRSFRIAENGDLIVDCMTEFLQLDPADGTIKHVYTADTADGGTWNDGWTVTGNTLVLSAYDRIVWYDLTTGAETRSVPCTSTVSSVFDGSKYRVMDFAPDGSLIFADSKGIFRLVEGSETLERLADGSLVSLSAPSVTQMGLLAGDGTYLALCWSDALWTLLSYSYDPNVPTLPEQELLVWSLTEDPLLRQAILAFQTKEPQVHVNYQVGLAEDSSATREDAMRALSTQITAGKCPDVLVLDGLPYEDYVEKGVLTDLSERLEPLLSDGSLLSNIATAYRRADGGTYAVPAQFQVPLMHGRTEDLSAATSLSALADQLEAVSSGFTLPWALYTVGANLRFLYPPLAASLTGPEGMDEAALRDFLLSTKRITDLRDGGTDWSDYNSEIDFSFGALALATEVARLDVGNLCKLDGLFAAWTVDQKQSSYGIESFLGSNTFLPVTALGISAQSTRQESAWSFVEAVLSPTVQEQPVGLGLPVSTAALDTAARATGPRSDDSFAYYATSFPDKEGAAVPIELEVLYPTVEWRLEMVEWFKSLDTPILYDEVVLNLLLDGTADYFSGKADLDATVTTLLQKLRLYEAE